MDPDLPAKGDAYEHADMVLVVSRFRPALAPVMTALALTVAAAALDRLIWRFRYPADPAMAVAAGGLFAPLALIWSAVVRYRLPRGGHGRAKADGPPSLEGDSDAGSVECGAGRRRIDGVVSR